MFFVYANVSNVAFNAAFDNVKALTFHYQNSISPKVLCVHFSTANKCSYLWQFFVMTPCWDTLELVLFLRKIQPTRLSYIVFLFYRSGLAAKSFIDVGAGVVDEDYRGPLGVVLFNHANADFEVKQGDRIAQLICEKIVYPELVEVEDLDQTERGEGGFGSTGVK